MFDEPIEPDSNIRAILLKKMPFYQLITKPGSLFKVIALVKTATEYKLDIEMPSKSKIEQQIALTNSLTIINMPRIKDTLSLMMKNPLSGDIKMK